MSTAAVALIVVVLGAPLWQVVQPGARGRRVRRRAPHRREPDDVAAFLGAVATEIRSGASLAAAVSSGADRAPAFQPMADRLRHGGSLHESLGHVTLISADVALAVRALTAAAEVGGPVAATLDSAAAVVRERAAARAERRAHSAQARLSARVLTIVPLAFTAWNVVSSARARAVYQSPPGLACVAAGLLLNVAGWQWMRRSIGR